MNKEDVIQFIEKKEGKTIEEYCKEFEDQTILWINPGKVQKYELVLWDKDYQEVIIREVSGIQKSHPRTKLVERYITY